jgi:hypothetical protein
MPIGTNPATRLFEAPSGGRRDPWYVDGQFMGDRDGWRRTISVGDLTSFTAVSIIDSDWTTVLATPAVGLVTGHPMVRQPWEPIRSLELNQSVSTWLAEGMRVSVTGVWGFPAVPGTVRQAVLDAIVATMDRNVEQYRQDLTPVATGDGGTVIAQTSSPMILSMPAATLAVAWSLRDKVLA